MDRPSASPAATSSTGAPGHGGIARSPFSCASVDATSSGKNELSTTADAAPTAAETEGCFVSLAAACTARYCASETYVRILLTAACPLLAGCRATTSATARRFQRTLVLTSAALTFGPVRSTAAWLHATAATSTTRLSAPRSHPVLCIEYPPVGVFAGDNDTCGEIPT